MAFILTLFDTLLRAPAAPVFGPTRKSQILFGCGLAFVAVVAGLMVSVLPYWFIIAATTVPLFFALVAWRIEYGVLAVLALASGIVDENFLPALSPLRAMDMALFAVVAIVVAGGSSLSKDFHPSEWKLWIPFTAFLLLVPVSVVYAHFFQGVALKDVLGEGRHLMYLLLLPLVVAVLTRRERVHRFIVGLLVLGLLFSVGQVVQGIFQVRVFGDAGRLFTAETFGVKAYGATSSSTQGINLIVFALCMVAAWYALKKVRVITFLLLSAAFAIAILLTFGRTTWVMTLLAVGVVVALLGLRKSGPMLIWSMVGLSLAFCTLIAVKPAMLDALVVRVTSVEREIESGSSAAWRYYEVAEVTPLIVASPVLGVGLGAAYRRPALSDTFQEQVRYIHSGYLYMVSKLGVPALSLFLWCLLVVLKWSWHGARNETDAERRGVHAAIGAGIVGLLLASVTEPHFMRDASIAYLGVLLGLATVLRRSASLPATTGTENTVPASYAAATGHHVIRSADRV